MKHYGVQIYNMGTDVKVFVIAQDNSGWFHRSNYKSFSFMKPNWNIITSDFSTAKAIFTNPQDAISYIVAGKSSQGIIQDVPSCAKLRAIRMVQNIYAKVEAQKKLDTLIASKMEKINALKQEINDIKKSLGLATA